MQGCLTKLRILFHCLLDGGQFTVSRAFPVPLSPVKMALVEYPPSPRHP